MNGGGNGGAARVDAVVVGAGQAGLSVAYHLQKAGGLRVVALDANEVSCCCGALRSCNTSVVDWWTMVNGRGELRSSRIGKCFVSWGAQLVRTR